MKEAAVTDRLIAPLELIRVRSKPNDRAMGTAKLCRLPVPGQFGRRVHWRAQRLQLAAETSMT